MASPIDALYMCHSLNRDITGSAKCPPEKQTRSHWTVETLHRQFLSVAMLLCNKSDFSFGANSVFAEIVTFSTYMCITAMSHTVTNMYFNNLRILFYTEPNMKWIHKLVVPHVSYCWKKVADFLEYPIPKKKEIEERQRSDPAKCCAELLEDWLSTDNGVKPKTWSKLLGALKEIGELRNSCLSIEEGLLKENLICKQ